MRSQTFNQQTDQYLFFLTFPPEDDGPEEQIDRPSPEQHVLIGCASH